MNHTIRRWTLSLITLALLAFAACSMPPRALKLEIDGERDVAFSSPTEEYTVAVTAYDRDGNVIESPELRWYSLNPKIADVTPTGVIKPKANGETRIVVRSGYAQYEIRVSVNLDAPTAKPQPQS
ncbi:hypothetical protein L6R52_16165 [Myxococcota bacterium]|nr:hypothetical protein [Myxococcota bacterium]